jgi:hypothetical protein
MKRKLPVKSADIVIIFIALGLIVYWAVSVYALPGNTAQVMIQGSGQIWLFPLDADETVSVPGPIGNTIIRIHDNKAWVESSPCDNQICVAGGRIHQPGIWIACLPNNVLLRIKGSEESSSVHRTTWRQARYGK